MWRETLCAACLVTAALAVPASGTHAATSVLVDGVVVAVGPGDGAPLRGLAGARVTAYDATSGGVVDSALTDPVGRYRLRAAGATALVLRASHPEYLPTWAFDQPTRAAAAVISVALPDPLGVVQVEPLGLVVREPLSRPPRLTRDPGASSLGRQYSTGSARAAPHRGSLTVVFS